MYVKNHACLAPVNANCRKESMFYRGEAVPLWQLQLRKVKKSSSIKRTIRLESVVLRTVASLPIATYRFMRDWWAEYGCHYTYFHSVLS